MKTYSLLIALVFSGLLSACSNSSNSNNSSAAVSTITCPVGTSLQNNVCVTANGTVVSGINTSGIVGYYSDTWDGQNLLSITDQTDFNAFLRDAMVICDQDGMAPCSYWNGGPFDVVMQEPNPGSNTVQVVFRVRPPQGMVPYLGNGTAVLQLSNMPVSLTNNNTGFEARGYGNMNTPANRTLFQVQVATGQLGQTTAFGWRLAYNGSVIASGTFAPCTTAACGLNSNIGYY